MTVRLLDDATGKITDAGNVMISSDIYGLRPLAANASTLCWGSDAVVWCRALAGGDAWMVVTTDGQTVHALAIDGTHAYVRACADAMCACDVIERIPLAGGPIEVLAEAGPSFGNAQIAISGTSVFFFDQHPNSTGTIRRITKSGGGLGGQGGGAMSGAGGTTGAGGIGQ